MSLNILLSVSSIAHPVTEESGGGVEKGQDYQKLFILGAERGKTRTSEGEWILSVAYETLEGLIMWFLTRSDKRNSWYLTDLTGAHGAIMSWCCSSLPVDFVEYNSRPFSLFLFIYHCLAGAQFPSFMGTKVCKVRSDWERCVNAVSWVQKIECRTTGHINYWTDRILVTLQERWSSVQAVY